VTNERFQAITEKFSNLRIALVGDFCLDRYLEIDPAREEISIETRLPVHNVVNLRTQPGGAGTILNNLAALRAKEIHPVGFCGEDGEGFELRRELEAKPGVTMAHFVQTKQRRTFTYCKPLVIEPNQPPRELNRLDSKNWTPTPVAVEEALIQAVRSVAEKVDAMILLDQVDVSETGVVTRRLLETVREFAKLFPKLLILADSRRGLRDFPPVIFKMNANELAALTGNPPTSDLEAVKKTAVTLARHHGQPVFITLSERGIIGALPNGAAEHVPAFPVHGPLDVVGAGDSVAANLTMALTAGATLREALELANAAASVVVHQLGTTGTASVAQLRELLFRAA
jgi:rfaE bifunctional protein kinase chain/domain